MKICAFLCTYNDSEYLDQTIESFKWFPDRLYIIEGAWKSSQSYNNSGPRSDAETYAIINKHVDNRRVFLVRANEARERDQRQIGLDIAKAQQADWCWMLDSDEVYMHHTLSLMRFWLETASPEVLGFRVRSFNFLNDFNTWYDGNYMRIYRPTPEAKFIMDNDVQWNRTGRIYAMPEQYRFFHYNYVKKNCEQFWRKMHYQAEQDPTFNQRLLPHYGFDNKGYKIPADIKTYEYVGKHPKIMQSHPYFVNYPKDRFYSI